MGSRSGNPHVVFAGGGTGGHLYPMLSVAREIQRRVPEARLGFLTTERAIDERIIRGFFDGDGDRPAIVGQNVRPLPRSLGSVPRFLWAWGTSLRQCRRMFRAEAPDVVMGSGGYGSAPPICAAHRLRIPSVLLNPDAIPGRANRFLAGKVDAIFVQWPVTRAHLPDRAAVEVAGCPVRREFQSATRQGAVGRFGLDPYRRTLLVTGASQGAHSINQAMAATVPGLWGVAGWQFLHLTGMADVSLVREAYRGRSTPAVVLDYTEHMADALAATDLVVSRAGASTLAEITARGIPSILMPYPHHKDRHQYANASVLADAGAAVIVEDRIRAEENAVRLGDVLGNLMRDADALDRMGRKAASLGTSGAASTIAEKVLALAGFSAKVAHEGEAPSVDSEKWSDFGPADDDENITMACGSGGAVDHALMTTQNRQ